MDGINKYYKALLKSQQLALTTYFNLFDLNKLIRIPPSTKSDNDQTLSLRLGHFAEHLFIDLLKQNITDKQVISNVQVTHNKITNGELDVIIYDQNNLEHIEFCYKFYLLDKNKDQKEFYNWIGPNRRDALHLKVKKLIDKQLPLFYSWNAKETLPTMIPRFKMLKKTQSVCFLAQLYVHYSKWETKEAFEIGTPDGFYLYLHELDNFTAHWHIPVNKREWILPPHNNVAWINNSELLERLKKYYVQNSNPLCWVKNKNGEIQKCFVVNWKDLN